MIYTSPVHYIKIIGEKRKAPGDIVLSQKVESDTITCVL